jgi:autotransporter-associated beta strand protein
MLRIRTRVVAVAFVVIAAGRGSAGDNTWTNAASNLTWNTTSVDWTAPTVWNNANTDSAIFGSTGAGSISVATGITLRGMKFTANGYTLAGSSALTLANGGGGTLGVGEVQVGTGVSAAVSAPIGGSVGLNKTGAGMLALGGANTYLGGTTVSAGAVAISADGNLGAAAAGLTLNGGTLVFTGTGSVTAVSSSRAVTLGASGGTIDTSNLGASAGNVTTVAAAIGGTGNLALNAHGDTSDTGGGSNSLLTLSGANTFTGTVTVNSGVVDANSNFGNAANGITINGGGLVATATTTLARNITLAGTGDRVIRVFGGATLTIGNTISGSGTLRKTDAGTLILTGNHSYTGGTVIASGALQLGTGAVGGSIMGSLVDNAVLISDYNGAAGIGGITGNGAVVQAGTGTLTFSGTSNTWTGGTVVNAGTARLANSGALPAGGPVTISNSNFDLNGFNQTIGALSFPLSLTANSTVATGAGTLTLGGDITFDTGTNSTGHAAIFYGTLNLGGATRTVNIPHFSFDNYDVVVNATITGTGGLTLSTPIGYLALTAANTYVGPTTIGAGGTLYTGVTNALPITTDLTVNGAFATAYINSLGVSVGTYNQQVASLAGTGTVNLGAGTLTVSSGSSSTFAGAIQGSTSLVKAGSGTLMLTGANTYTGTTTVSGGTLQVGAGGTNGTLPGNVTDNANLAFNRTDSVSFGGLVSGTGSLTQAGAGTLTLTNSGNSYTGGTFVTAGTLKLGSVTAIPSGTNVTVQAGGTFDTGGAGMNSVGQAVGAVTVNGGTIRDGSSANAYYAMNTLTINAGGGIDATGAGFNSGIALANSGAAVTVNANSVWSGPANFGIANDAGAELPVTIAPGVTVTSSISISSLNATPANSIRITGGGTLYLTNPVFYTGTFVRVNQARLRKDDLSGVGPGSFELTLDNGTLTYGGGTVSSPATFALAAAGGTVEVLNPATVLTMTGALSGGGPLTKAGPGTLVLGNAASNFGGLTVAQGTLSVAADNQLGSAATVTTIGALGTLSFSASATTGRTVQNLGGTLQAAAGTLTLNGATVGGGFLRGPGTFAVTGGTLLSGVTTPNSTVVNQTGPASYANFTNGGSLTVSAGQTGSMTAFVNQGSGTLVLAAGGSVNASDFQTYGTVTLSPGPSTSNPTQLTNVGTSPLSFNGGSRTFVSDVAHIGGPAYVDLHGQDAIVAGGLFVNNGAVFDSLGSPSNHHNLIADYGATIKGAGAFQFTPVTQNGGKFSPGNSPGPASFGEFKVGPGGVSNYVFQIDDATGAAGPSPDAQGYVSGWDLAKAVPQIGPVPTSGDFVWAADSAHPLTVAIDTLVNPTTVGTDVAGPMANFDPNLPNSWTAVEWTGNYSGPTNVAALDATTVFDTSGVSNTFSGSFGWEYGGDGHSLALTYTPVPEPGTLWLTTAAAGWVAVWRRRRRET